MATTATTWTTSSALLAGAVSLLPALMPVGAQSTTGRTPAGFNLFSVEQDVEIGRAAAAEIERQVRLTTSVRTTQFLNDITALLARQTSSPFGFRVRAINSSDANVFALPGGEIFVTRGLLSLTRNEAQVAGIIAHAMAHVLLRHGTARASKAYLSKAGLSALGGVAQGAGATSRIINTVGGFGVNAAFLTFSRADEYEADALGAELISSAGYDPVAIATLLSTLRRESARFPGIDRLNGNHPLPSDRETRVRNLSNILRHGRSEVVGGFSRMRWGSSAPAGLPAPPEVKISTGTVELRAAQRIPAVPAPSPQFTRFTTPDASIAIDHPANWDAHQSGSGMTFVPAGGVVERDDGASSILQGMVLNHYEPFEDDVERWNNSLARHYAPFEDRSRPRGILEDATDDLVRQILNANTWLTAPKSARAESVDGQRGYSIRLSGRSPLTGELERVTLYTRALSDDQVVYMACVAAGRAAISVERACAKMVQSLRVTEAIAHRQQR